VGLLVYHSELKWWNIGLYICWCLVVVVAVTYWMKIATHFLSLGISRRYRKLVFISTRNFVDFFDTFKGNIIWQAIFGQIFRVLQHWIFPDIMRWKSVVLISKPWEFTDMKKKIKSSSFWLLKPTSKHSFYKF